MGLLTEQSQHKASEQQEIADIGNLHTGTVITHGQHRALLIRIERRLKQAITIHFNHLVHPDRSLQRSFILLLYHQIAFIRHRTVRARITL